MKQLILATFFILLGFSAIVPLQKAPLLGSPIINYPVRFAYINRINSWWPAQKIAAGLGVPGYASTTMYNYIAFAFWTYQSGPLDIVLLWSDPLTYFGAVNPFGTTKDQIQKTLKKKYNDAGIKLLISAFGATQFPTTAKIDPTACAIKLANFVLQNNLDGVDIDWEDTAALQAGTGEAWLITFQKKLRSLLPNHIITHAPQAPYFKKQIYKNGAYINVNTQVGSTIDFYNVQFYNQGNSKYDTYSLLFLTSGGYFTGTSVKEIISKGIPAKKIVIGKPVTSNDVGNSGWMDLGILGDGALKAYTDMKWYGGIMLWQYASDLNGTGIKKAVQKLYDICNKNKNCI